MRELDIYKRRYTRAQSVAYQWWPMLQAAYHYCVPSRNLYYWTNQVQGAQKNVQVFDTTQVAATRSFVSKMQQALCPPQMTWAMLETGAFVPEDQQEQVNLQLQEITNTIFTFIRGSNFDVAINECFFDLATGTAVLCINEGTSDDEPLIFGSIPLAQVALEESIYGRAESCYRAWGDVKISDIKMMWPKARLTQMMEQLVKEDPSATCKNLIEAVVYCPEEALPYKYVLWNEDDILLQEEDVTSPLIVFRISKVNNEVFGRGPIIDALPSIISLQTVAYYELTAANLNICKPYMAYSDGVFNPWTFVIAPNTVIPVSPTTNGQFPIQPMPDVANPAFMQLVSQDLRMQINKLMYAEPLGPVDAPTRTATEMSIRQRSLAEEIGPMFTRLQQEFLAPTLNRIIHILQKRGLIPKVIVDGKEITIRYKSPLTQSQGQQEVQTFIQYQQIMQGIVGPENAIPYINTTKISSWLANKMGVDVSILNTEEQMQKFMREKQEEMMMMQEGAANESGAQSAIQSGF